MSMKKKRGLIFIISLITLCLLSISSFSSGSNTSNNSISTEKQECSTLLDPPVGVEFDHDPIPVPRRVIPFRVYSNDETISFVNIDISYTNRGKTLYSKEGKIPVSIGKPHEMSLKLSNYGFGIGKLGIHLWEHSETHDFDWTFPAKTWGWLFFVSLL